MPIKFLCEHCNSKLQVATRKASTQQTCPRCKKTILIPEPEIAEAMLAMKTSDRFSESWEDEDFLEFAIYDDEELFYDDAEDALLQSPKIARVDPSRISIPRTALYIQGALLGVVGALLLDHFGLIAPPGEIYYIDHVPFRLLGRDILAVAAATLFFTLACTVYGARRAGALQPIEALRGP